MSREAFEQWWEEICSLEGYPSTRTSALRAWQARDAEVEALREEAINAVKEAWALGQTYWQQADSESFSQNKKSEATLQKFLHLMNALAEVRPSISQRMSDAGYTRSVKVNDDE